MHLSRLAVILIAAALSGCVSHEGTYSPDCIAYAGSNIELSDGRFVWEKFTDQVVVDDEGRVINQFPGYPIKGSYRIDGQTVYMESDDGESMETMYLHRRDNRYYLLTAEQSDTLRKTGKYPDCALMLGASAD
jgi:hypothetical protein